MTFNGIKYMRADGSAWGGFAACREGDVGAFPVIAQEDVADQVRAAYEQGRGELEQLRAFAKAIMGDWPDVGGLDGFDLQQLGVKHGLLERLERIAPCGEHCSCAENETGLVECFRLTPLVTGKDTTK